MGPYPLHHVVQQVEGVARKLAALFVGLLKPRAVARQRVEQDVLRRARGETVGEVFGVVRQADQRRPQARFGGFAQVAQSVVHLRQQQRAAAFTVGGVGRLCRFKQSQVDLIRIQRQRRVCRAAIGQLHLRGQRVEVPSL